MDQVTHLVYGTTTVLIAPVAAPEAGEGPKRRERERSATESLLTLYFGSREAYRLTHAPSGAPLLETHGRPWHLSISHSRTRAAIALDPCTPVGIDVEEWRSQLVRVASKYIGSGEASVWGASPLLMLRAWMAKEAAYKLFQPQGVTLLSIALEATASGAVASLGERRAVITFGAGMALAQPQVTL